MTPAENLESRIRVLESSLRTLGKLVEMIMDRRDANETATIATLTSLLASDELLHERLNMHRAWILKLADATSTSLAPTLREALASNDSEFVEAHLQLLDTTPQ